MLHGSYAASSLIRAHPPPSRRQSISRLSRLYDQPSPAISRRDEEGFSSCSACPCRRAVASTPPKWECRIGQISAPHAAFALRLRARPSDPLTFEATCTFTVVTARRLVIPPRRTLSIGFRVLVSRHPAIQTTGLLTIAPAGLSPAEHASLRWTHNRAGGFPAHGSPVGGFLIGAVSLIARLLEVQTTRS